MLSENDAQRSNNYEMCAVECCNESAIASKGEVGIIPPEGMSSSKEKYKQR